MTYPLALIDPGVAKRYELNPFVSSLRCCCCLDRSLGDIINAIFSSLQAPVTPVDANRPATTVYHFYHAAPPANPAGSPKLKLTGVTVRIATGGGGDDGSAGNCGGNNCGVSCGNCGGNSCSNNCGGNSCTNYNDSDDGSDSGTLLPTFLRLLDPSLLLSDLIGGSQEQQQQQQQQCGGKGASCSSTHQCLSCFRRQLRLENIDCMCL